MLFKLIPERRYGISKENASRVPMMGIILQMVILMELKRVPYALQFLGCYFFSFLVVFILFRQ